MEELNHRGQTAAWPETIVIRTETEQKPYKKARPNVVLVTQTTQGKAVSHVSSEEQVAVMAKCRRQSHTTPSPPSSMPVCCSVGVRVADVGMYVCGPACCAWCGVLQRRPNSDAFLKVLGSCHVCKFALNWRRVQAYQLTVFADIYVSHYNVDHG